MSHFHKIILMTVMSNSSHFHKEGVGAIPDKLDKALVTRLEWNGAGQKGWVREFLLI